MTELESKIVALLAEHLCVDEADVKPGSSLAEDLGADSLDTVELAMVFEEEFGIELDASEFPDGVLVHQVIDMVVARVAAK